MRGVFDEEVEKVRADHHQDTELTLGTGSLLAMFFGLLVLCGLCFAAGYAVGHHGPTTTARNAPQAATEQEPLQATGNIPKPSAIAQTPVTPPPDAATDQASAPAAGTVAPVPAPAVAAPAAAPAASNYPQVHAALPSGNGLPVYSPAPAQNQRSAPAAQPFMVQIAAVSNPEDAEVLIGALRRRNYPVMARREPADNFIHVRIGPFATRAVAEQWRMKLLNDGYNAEIQP